MRKFAIKITDGKKVEVYSGTVSIICAIFAAAFRKLGFATEYKTKEDLISALNAAALVSGSKKKYQIISIEDAQKFWSEHK